MSDAVCFIFDVRLACGLIIMITTIQIHIWLIYLNLFTIKIYNTIRVYFKIEGPRTKSK